MEGGITKNIIIAILILSACCSVASADLGIADALSDIISRGMEKFWVNMADMMYEFSYQPEGHEFNGTGVEVFVYAVTTHTADPWSNDGVQDFRRMTILWLILYGGIYSVLGFIYVAWSLVYPESMNIIADVLNRNTSHRQKTTKEYFENLLVYVFAVALTDIVIRMLFTLNFFVVSILLVSSMETHSLTVSADNFILYIAMGVFYFILTGFMIVRELMLYIFVLVSYIIGILLISNKTRNMGISIMYYFTSILFFQSSIVLLTTTGYIGAKGICNSFGIIIGSIAEIFIYALLMFILIIWSFIAFASLILFRRRVVKKVRMVI